MAEHKPAAEMLGYYDATGTRVAAVLHRGDHDAHRIVVMAHGFHSSKIGPSRYFVGIARSLAARGISTFRFDQPGSGDSEGAFEDSSFLTWTDTIEHFVRRFAEDGNAVALLGQSMGGTATLAAATRLGDAVKGIALWSPDPMLHADPTSMTGEWMEEEGERVRPDFWREAASIDFLALYLALTSPAYMVFGTADAFIPVEDIRTVEAARKKGDRIRVVEGLPHSAWADPKRTEIMQETLDFLTAALSAS